MHALEGLACRKRVAAAVIARLPPPASRMRRSRHLRDTLAAAPGLLAHASVTETVNLCPMGQKLRYTAVLCCTYRSTTVQLGNIWGASTTEPYNRLQSAVLSLSSGPVAPADKIGFSNTELIMMACMIDGTLLQVHILIILAASSPNPSILKLPLQFVLYSICCSILNQQSVSIPAL